MPSEVIPPWPFVDIKSPYDGICYLFHMQPGSLHNKHADLVLSYMVQNVWGQDKYQVFIWPSSHALPCFKVAYLIWLTLSSCLFWWKSFWRILETSQGSLCFFYSSYYLGTLYEFEQLNFIESFKGSYLVPVSVYLKCTKSSGNLLTYVLVQEWKMSIALVSSSSIKLYCDVHP